MIRYRSSKKVKDPSDAAHAYEYAIFLLSLRLRTEAEMRKKMSDRGYLPIIIDETISQLLTEKLLDDDRYAEIYIDNLKKYKDYGYFMIKKKLMEKLLPTKLIDQKLEELMTIEDELKVASRFMKRETGSSIKLSRDQKTRLLGKLQRRGFRADVVTRLIF